jgi:CheY-like chemotaxis protein
MPIEQVSPDRLLSPPRIAAMLQMNAAAVIKWVDAGKLKSYRTPGGQRRILARELVRFLAEVGMPIPRTLLGAARRRLLVVDDDARQLAAYKRFFKRYAHAVDGLFIDNGIEALLRVGMFFPTLVVLDYLMPNLDGVEVCRRIKAFPETEATRVVLVSGHLTAEVEKQALAAGAERCLSKPADTGILLDVLGVDPIFDVPTMEA